MLPKILIVFISFIWVYLSTKHVGSMKYDLIMSGACRYCEAVPDFISKLSDRNRIFLFTYDLPGFINYYLLNPWSGLIVKSIAGPFGIKDFGTFYLVAMPVTVVIYAFTIFLVFMFVFGIYKGLSLFLRKN